MMGAGPAGLASAGTMGAAGLNVTPPQKADSVGAVWRRRCDCLHPHTDGNHSGLPDMAMPQTYPTIHLAKKQPNILKAAPHALRSDRIFLRIVRSPI
jgi:cation diffusion facilitator CzcD-associated flavoprotein CzcO